MNTHTVRAARFLRNALLTPLLCTACGTGTSSSRVPDARDPIRLQSEIAEYPEGDVASVHLLWAEYRQSIRGQSGCEPSTYWLDAEHAPFTMPNGVMRPRCTDLATSALWPQDQPAEVLSIERVSDETNTLYRITTRYTPSNPPDSGSAARSTVTTVFAVRTNGEWKLSGSIVQLTRGWRREVVGPFTYVVSPTLQFSERRAADAVKFADSLSKAFGVPPLTPIHYYLVRDGDEMLRLKGIQLDTVYGTPGGQSLVGAIISGDTVFGENHAHEIAHVLIIPLTGPNLHIVASEGVPTWLGGTRSLRYPAALGVLREFLSTHPQAILDSLIASNQHPLFNHSSALLAQLVHEARGVAGIRQFMNSGPSLPVFKQGVERILAKPWADISAEWKRRAMAVTGEGAAKTNRDPQ